MKKTLDPRHLLSRDLTRLTITGNPGEGILIGRTEDHLVLACWVHDANASSFRRGYTESDGEVSIAPFASDTPLGLSYPVMTERKLGPYVVGNGRHVEDALQGLSSEHFGHTISHIRRMHTFKQDEHETPLITGGIRRRDKELEYQLLLQKKGIGGTLAETHHFVCNEMPFGYGRCLTSYAIESEPTERVEGTGFSVVRTLSLQKIVRDPMPYAGEPLFLPVPDDPEAMLALYSMALEGDCFSALAVKYVDLKTRESTVLIHNVHATACAGV